MAHFKGTVQGRGRTEASQLGSKGSGLTLTGNGWTTGVAVRVWHDEDTGEDVVVVMRSSGSSDKRDITDLPIITEWREKAGG